MFAWTVIGIGGAVLIAMLIKNYVIPLIQKTKSTTTAPVTTATTVPTAPASVDADYADMITAIGACFTITAIAKKRKNAALVAEVAALRVSIAKLTEDLVNPTA